MMKQLVIDACCLSARLGDISDKSGFDGVLLECPSKGALPPKSDKRVLGTRRTISVPMKAASFDQVKGDLVSARDECDVVALCCDNEFILKRLLETELHLIDVLTLSLDSINALKPAVVKQLVKQGIMFEIQISQLLKLENRGRLLGNARHVIRTYARRSRGILNLVVSTGASTKMGARNVDEMKSIGMALGLREEDARAAITSSVQVLLHRARQRRSKYLEIKEKMVLKQNLSSFRKRAEDSDWNVARKKVNVWNG